MHFLVIGHDGPDVRDRRPRRRRGAPGLHGRLAAAAAGPRPAAVRGRRGAPRQHPRGRGRRHRGRSDVRDRRAVRRRGLVRRGHRDDVPPVAPGHDVGPAATTARDPVVLRPRDVGVPDAARSHSWIRTGSSPAPSWTRRATTSGSPALSTCPKPMPRRWSGGWSRRQRSASGAGGAAGATRAEVATWRATGPASGRRRQRLDHTTSIGLVRLEDLRLGLVVAQSSQGRVRGACGSTRVAQSTCGGGGRFVAGLALLLPSSITAPAPAGCPSRKRPPATLRRSR